jgi:hypothetical protein
VKKRAAHLAGFKAQLVLAAVKGDKTVSALASLQRVQPTLIHAWKKQLLDNVTVLFENGAKCCSHVQETEESAMFAGTRSGFCSIRVSSVRTYWRKSKSGAGERFIAPNRKIGRTSMK